MRKILTLEMLQKNAHSKGISMRNIYLLLYPPLGTVNLQVY